MYPPGSVDPTEFAAKLMLFKARNVISLDEVAKSPKRLPLTIAVKDVRYGYPTISPLTRTRTFIQFGPPSINVTVTVEFH